jgi:tyrosine-protein phosphatase YwqE
MKSIFSKIFGGRKEAERLAGSLSDLKADMHSHILPGLDDGAETLEKSLELVEKMVGLGYQKLIMTPHIMGDFYKNTPEGIREKLELLRNAVQEKGWNMQLDFAAEYYLDEWFIRKLENNEKLLTFGDNYLLFETSYINEPSFLKDAVFQIQSAGYKPVLAHPERYTYLYGKFSDLEKLREAGVLMQLNLNSLGGYYSEGAKRVAEKLVDAKMVEFAGTDAHSMKHLTFLQKAMASKYFGKLMQLPLRNSQL